MRVNALAGLFAIILLAASSSTVSASALEISKPINNKFLAVTKPVSMATIANTNRNDAPAASPEPIKYTVVENDSLSKIAKQYNTDWRRLFDKNEQIADPDLLFIGLELTIPAEGETLEQRPLPEPPAPAPQPQNVPESAAARTSSPAPAAPQAIAASNSVATGPRGAVAGNTYTAGYCTWYVKNKRPDLPNNLGNANTWVSRAAAQGIPTGSTPSAGAVGQRGMHVVYVERVNGDGTVTISEMNHTGLYVITTRTLPASYFSYIY